MGPVSFMFTDFKVGLALLKTEMILILLMFKSD